MQLAGEVLSLSGKWLAFEAWEIHGEDLNGDGDAEDKVLHVHDLEAGETTNLELVFAHNFLRLAATSETHMAFAVDESDQQEDLNGDGDTWDSVVHLRDLDSGETTNLKSGCNVVALSAEWLALEVCEQSAGEDLNGDGDTRDSVLHVHDLSSGESTNVRLSSWFTEGRTPNNWRPSPFSGKWLAFRSSERDAQRDLNGDGDRGDTVVYVQDLEAGETRTLGEGSRSGGLAIAGDWLAFERDGLVHIADLRAREVTNLGFMGGVAWFPGSFSGKWLAIMASEGGMHLLNLDLIMDSPRFVRGDCNADSEVNVADAICILARLILGADASACVAASNVNDDDSVDVSDPVFLLNHLFAGGPAPPAPFPDCGPASLASDNVLGCANPPDCQ